MRRKRKASGFLTRHADGQVFPVFGDQKKRIIRRPKYPKISKNIKRPIPVKEKPVEEDIPWAAEDYEPPEELDVGENEYLEIVAPEEERTYTIVREPTYVKKATGFLGRIKRGIDRILRVEE